MPKIANTDLDVYPLNLGGNTFGWTSDEAESFEVLDLYFNSGGNFIDTADMYSQWAEGNSGGESETILGRWMASRGVHDRVVIATKVGKLDQLRGLAPEVVRAGCEASLKRLGVEAIDLFYAHADDETRAIAELAQTFSSLVDEGSIRAIGLSNFSAERTSEWVEHARAEGLHVPVALQPNYSLVNRAYEHTLRPVAEHYGLSVFCYSSLASGFLTGKYRGAQDAAGTARGGSVSRYFTEDGFGVIEVLGEIAAEHGVEHATVALAWLLAKGITAPIASASTARQLPALLAATTITLSPQQLERLEAASATF